MLGKKIFKGKIKFNKNSSLEAQIASISDDIAYNSHDLEDGFNANLFTIQDLLHIPILSDVIIKHKKKINKNNKELVLRQIVREIINEMVKDVILNTKKNIKVKKIKSIKDVYNCDSSIVNFSKKMILFDISVKNFLRERMYYSKEVIKKTNQGKNIIKSLFIKIKKNPKKYIKKDLINNNIERSICDFIAGMTDRFAINLHKRMKWIYLKSTLS